MAELVCAQGWRGFPWSWWPSGSWWPGCPDTWPELSGPWRLTRCPGVVIPGPVRPGSWFVVRGQLAVFRWPSSCAPGAWSIGLNCCDSPREPAPAGGQFPLIALIGSSQLVWPAAGPSCCSCCLDPGPRTWRPAAWSVGHGQLAALPAARSARRGRVPAAIVEFARVLAHESCSMARALAAHALARFHTNNHH